jgi:hypothetical protein
MARPAAGKITQKAEKLIDGKIYVPVLYHGKWEGYGTYIAAQTVTPQADKTEIWELYRDSEGKPVPYKKL